jgi:hypothetical protein
VSQFQGGNRAEITLLFMVGTILVLGCFSLFVSRFFPTQVSLSGIPLQRSIGQMIVTGFSGDTADAPDFQRAVRNLEDGIIGGVLFLPNNIASKQELEQMLKTVHDCICKIPPLIAIDEEGGVVDRLGDHDGFIHIPSPADVQRDGLLSARTRYDLLAKELVGTGFNLNLAPVVDLNINPENPIIGLRDRSYSDDPETVTAFARAFIEAHRASGVLTSLKHFPGHGSSTADSHTTIVDVSGTWSENELLPYQQLINANLVDTIMIGHLLNSKRWGGISSQEGTAIHDLLRKTLHYDGVTISDDLTWGRARRGIVRRRDHFCRKNWDRYRADCASSRRGYGVICKLVDFSRSGFRCVIEQCATVLVPSHCEAQTQPRVWQVWASSKHWFLIRELTVWLSRRLLSQLLPRAAVPIGVDLRELCSEQKYLSGIIDPQQKNYQRACRSEA